MSRDCILKKKHHILCWTKFISISQCWETLIKVLPMNLIVFSTHVRGTEHADFFVHSGYIHNHKMSSMCVSMVYEAKQSTLSF